jgi:hypothetical protein
MLGFQSVCSHVVTIDDGSNFAWILAIFRKATTLHVISPP